jgi:DNA-binding PadR family transcriptional regulator
MVRTNKDGQILIEFGHYQVEHLKYPIYLIDKIRCNIFIPPSNEANYTCPMRKTFLGEFEEIVLLSVAVQDHDAYGVAVTLEIEKQTGRSVGFNSVHTTLQRLEEKGFLASKMGGATAERGGRRKRFFRLTAAGGRALKEVRDIRTQLWESLPPKAMYLTR